MCKLALVASLVIISSPAASAGEAPPPVRIRVIDRTAPEKGDVTIRLGPVSAGSTKAGESKSATQSKPKIRPRLFGRVLDRDGKPVGPYRVVAAAMPPDSLMGKEFYFAEEAKGIPAGKPWELTLYSDAKLYWVMAQAPGFASSSQVLPHGSIDRPIELRLGKGFSLSGKAEGPAVPAGKAVAMVQPMFLFDSNPAVEHAANSPLYGIQMSRAAVSAEGLFRFDHLAPDTYILQIVSPGATPSERLVAIHNKDIRLEEPLRLLPAGRIEGVVFDRDGKPMVGERCQWSAPVTLDPRVGEALWGRYTPGGIPFTTDEKGRFVLEGAPAGRVRVGFDYMLSMDMGASCDNQVQVVPNRTTEVRVNVPQSSPLCWKLPVEVTVGDGSRSDLVAGCCITNPDFLKASRDEPEPLDIPLEFEPVGEQAVSWPDANYMFDSMFVAIPSKGGPGRAVLTGIHAGRYSVMAFEPCRNGCADLRHSSLGPVVDVTPNMKEPLKLRLPAASVEVDFRHPRKDVTQWVVLLMALGENGKPLRQEFVHYCEADGTPPHIRPSLDFMPPGRYTLLAWRHGLGWARSGPIRVEKGKIARGGTMRFQPGGTICGRLALPEVCRLPDCVSVVDSKGVSIAAKSKWTPRGYTFTATDLWPGNWTVRILDSNRKILVEKSAELKGTEIVEIE